MAGREFLSLVSLARPSAFQSLTRIESEATDWVTIAVLTEKSAPRISANGSKYAIWKLQDLRGYSISLFLFSAAYELRWKEEPGNVFVVLNVH